MAMWCVLVTSHTPTVSRRTSRWAVSQPAPHCGLQQRRAAVGPPPRVPRHQCRTCHLVALGPPCFLPASFGRPGRCAAGERHLPPRRARFLLSGPCAAHARQRRLRADHRQGWEGWPPTVAWHPVFSRGLQARPAASLHHGPMTPASVRVLPVHCPVQYEDGVLELRIAKRKVEASRPEGRVIQVA